MAKSVIEKMHWRNEDGVFRGYFEKSFGVLRNIRVTVHKAEKEITVELKSWVHPMLDKAPVAVADLSDAETVIGEYFAELEKINFDLPAAVRAKAQESYDNYIDGGLAWLLQYQYN